MVVGEQEVRPAERSAVSTPFLYFDYVKKLTDKDRRCPIEIFNSLYN